MAAPWNALFMQDRNIRVSDKCTSNSEFQLRSAAGEKNVRTAMSVRLQEFTRQGFRIRFHMGGWWWLGAWPVHSGWGGCTPTASVGGTRMTWLCKTISFSLFSVSFSFVTHTCGVKEMLRAHVFWWRLGIPNMASSNSMESVSKSHKLCPKD